MIYLAGNLKVLRKERKMSQEKLADALGIKRSNIAAYESKNVEPRLKVIVEMARLFDISLKDFLTKDLQSEASYHKYHIAAAEGSS